MAIPTLVIMALAMPGYIAFIVSFVQEVIAAQQAGTTPSPPQFPIWFWTVVYPILILVGLWIWLGFTRYALQLGRGRLPTLGVLFKFDHFLPALGLAVLSVIATYVGFALLIVPGIILGLAWSMGYLFLVDRSLGPIEALKASWRLTSGSRWKLFGLGLLMMLISFGLQMVCVGIFWSNPLFCLAWTYVYLRLNGEHAMLPGQIPDPGDYVAPQHAWQPPGT